MSNQGGPPPHMLDGPSLKSDPTSQISPQLSLPLNQLPPPPNQLSAPSSQFSSPSNRFSSPPNHIPSPPSRHIPSPPSRKMSRDGSQRHSSVQVMTTHGHPVQLPQSNIRPMHFVSPRGRPPPRSRSQQRFRPRSFPPKFPHFPYRGAPGPRQRPPRPQRPQRPPNQRPPNSLPRRGPLPRQRPPFPYRPPYPYFPSYPVPIHRPLTPSMARPGQILPSPSQRMGKLWMFPQPIAGQTPKPPLPLVKPRRRPLEIIDPDTSAPIEFKKKNNNKTSDNFDITALPKKGSQRLPIVSLPSTPASTPGFGAQAVPNSPKSDHRLDASPSFGAQSWNKSEQTEKGDALLNLDQFSGPIMPPSLPHDSPKLDSLPPNVDNLDSPPIQRRLEITIFPSVSIRPANVPGFPKRAGSSRKDNWRDESDSNSLLVGFIEPKKKTSIHTLSLASPLDNQTIEDSSKYHPSMDTIDEEPSKAGSRTDISHTQANISLPSVHSNIKRVWGDVPKAPDPEDSKNPPKPMWGDDDDDTETQTRGYSLTWNQVAERKKKQQQRQRQMPQSRQSFNNNGLSQPRQIVNNNLTQSRQLTSSFSSGQTVSRQKKSVTFSRTPQPPLSRPPAAKTTVSRPPAAAKTTVSRPSGAKMAETNDSKRAWGDDPDDGSKPPIPMTQRQLEQQRQSEKARLMHEDRKQRQDSTIRRKLDRRRDYPDRELEQERLPQRDWPNRQETSRMPASEDSSSWRRSSDGFPDERKSRFSNDRSNFGNSNRRFGDRNNYGDRNNDRNNYGDRRNSGQFSSRNRGDSGSGFKAFLGGLPFQCEERDIEDFLQMEKSKIEWIRIIRDDSGQSRGFCYVQFTKMDWLEEALKLNEQLFLGRTIRVDYADDKRRNTGGRFGRDRSDDRRGDRWDDRRFGRSDDRSDSWRRSGDSGNWGRRDNDRRSGYGGSRDSREPPRRSAPPERRSGRRRQDGWVDGDNKTLALSQKSVVQESSESRPRLFDRREELTAKQPNDETDKVNTKIEEEDEGYRESEPVKKVDKPCTEKNQPSSYDIDPREKREKREKRERKLKKKKNKSKKEAANRYDILAGLSDDESS